MTPTPARVSPKPNALFSVILLLFMILIAAGMSSCAGYTSTSKSTSPDPVPLTISTFVLPAATVQTSYSATLSATGGTAPYNWLIASGSLPTGMVLASSGQISGTPAQAGSSSFTVQVGDSGSTAQTALKTLGIEVAGSAAPLQVSTSSLSGATQGQTYSTSLSASGGTPPYSWSIASGSLPTGMLLASSGQISGIPAQAGSASFTVQVRGSSSTAQTATKKLAIAVGASTIPLQITTSALPAGQVSANYSVTLAASGGTPPYT